jgi:murein DD-endopeptidase MepM/ murein hydrolase activator NlpD
MRILFVYLQLIGLILFFPHTFSRASRAADSKANVQTSKHEFPKNYFVLPTFDSVLNIAGNFGEIRPNHFHTGIDVKTGGREGMPIAAVADGYVSRIAISATGYGKALYVTHPNGYVSVYAHLQRLQGKIAKYLYEEQYKAESYEMDITVPNDLLPVKQHDTLGLSGNTGGSQSPHLHFEIRDALTEKAYNPFLFGYPLNDHVSPRLKTLAIYAVNDSGYVNGKTGSRKMRLYGVEGKYKLSQAEKITVSGSIGFGIETYDYADVTAAGKLGAYSVELQIDHERVYYHELNEISFDESRYINSHIDYGEDLKSNREIQKCFLDPNNMLSIYQGVVNKGIFRFNDANEHWVRLVVKDIFGNTSSAEVRVQSSPFTAKKPTAKPLLIDSNRLFKCPIENKFEADGVQVTIPPCSLYEDIAFNYAVSLKKLPAIFSPIHSIHQAQVPNHYSYRIAIQPTHLPERLQPKATIVLLDALNNKKDVKGEYNKGWVTAQTKYFGRYAVAVDTLKPMIKPRNIFNGKNMTRAKTIEVWVGDNLTGIKSYRATIDGKWVLMEYEPKKALLFYEFMPTTQKASTHIFELEVSDGKNNTRTFKATFIR